MNASSTDRREALIAKFRAGAVDRLNRSILILIEAEAGRANAEQLKELARELHTMKGEGRMLGLSQVSEVIHEIEGQLEILQKQGDGPSGYGSLIPYLQAVSQALVENPPAPTSLPPRGLDQGPAQARPSRRGGLSLPPPRVLANLSMAPSKRSLPTQLSGGASGGGASGPPHLRTPRAPVGGRYVQTSSASIDSLCDRVASFSSDFRLFVAHLRGDCSSINLRALREEAARCLAQMEVLTLAAWALRLTPIEPMFATLAQHARELAIGQRKRIRVILPEAGQSAQIERSTLEQLWDPLVHLIRNAIDHGLELPTERGDKGPEGRLTLGVEALGPNLQITVSDDGRGIEADKVKKAAIEKGLLSAEQAEDASLKDEEVFELLFTHGFSTKTEVSDVSGRGVGLDVVRGVVEGLGGSVRLFSAPGQGSTFHLTVPATFSKERMVVVDCAGTLFAIPSRHVLEVLRLADNPAEAVAGGLCLRRHEEMIPLRSLCKTLSQIDADEPWAMILDQGGRRYAFSISALIGESELLRQPTDALLAGLEYVGASAMMDDGRLALVITVPGLLRRAERGQVRKKEVRPEKRARRVLVVDDSAVVRDLVGQILSESGLEVALSHHGEAAVRKLESASTENEGLPDVVLLDVDMPVMDGFTALSQIKTRWPALPVIMFTTRHSLEDRERAERLGASAYLVKSNFEEDTLLQTVRRFFERQKGA